MSQISSLFNRQILANSLGNVLEWYDFTLYGTLAPIIAKLFFPDKDPLASLILTFAAFAAGFLMRPVGGIIYGHIGDRYGRRKALLSSIILMTIPTMLIGFLPTHASIGIAAPILISLLRLLQGLAVGGEFTGSMTFLIETAPNRRRGFAGSLALIGVLLGILLGSAIVSILTNFFSREALAEWLWRVPFLLGGVFGCGIWLLRRSMQETPVFEKYMNEKVHSNLPVFDCFRNYYKELIQAFAVTILNAFAFYILMIYTTTYFYKIIHFSYAKAAALNLYMVVLTLILIPFTGLLSDYIGRKKVLGLSALGFIVMGYPLDVYFLSNPALPLFLIGQAIICVLLAMYLGPLASTLAEIMPSKLRYTGLSISYNVALALFGGTAPLLVTYFIASTNVLTVPGVLLSCSAVISIIAILTLRESYKRPLL